MVVVHGNLLGARWNDTKPGDPVLKPLVTTASPVVGDGRQAWTVHDSDKGLQLYAVTGPDPSNVTALTDL